MRPKLRRPGKAALSGFDMLEGWIIPAGNVAVIRICVSNETIAVMAALPDGAGPARRFHSADRFSENRSVTGGRAFRSVCLFTPFSKSRRNEKDCRDSSLSSFIVARAPVSVDLWQALLDDPGVRIIFMARRQSGEVLDAERPVGKEATNCCPTLRIALKSIAVSI